MLEIEDHTDAAQRVVRRWHTDLSNKFWRVDTSVLRCRSLPVLSSDYPSSTINIALKLT